jgi:ABC-type dipeptide/oligopeptide/nickel transport system ATPase component
LSSLPRAAGEERSRIRLTGEIPSHANPPSGCMLHTRCPRYIGGIGKNEEPDFKGSNPGISGAATTRPTSCATCSAWRLTGSTLPGVGY